MRQNDTYGRVISASDWRSSPYHEHVVKFDFGDRDPASGVDREIFSRDGEARLGLVAGEEVLDLNLADPGLPSDMRAFLEAGAPALDGAARVNGARLRVTWDGGEQIVTVDKPANEPGTNFPMWKWQVCAAEALGLPRDVLVACGGVDNSCMALGARNTEDGRVYTSLGSSSWIAVSSAKPVLDPVAKPYVFTHVVPGLFTSAVSIFAGGSSFRWIRDAVLGGETAAGYDAMNAMAAASPVGANGLLFNPSLAGGSSQEPSPRIRGAFAGVDLRHTRADLVRAGMEGIAMNLGAVLGVLRRMVPLAPEMLMVGGGSRSPLWRQIFADVYGMDCVKTSVDQDAASLGAAAVAAVGAGLWRGFGKVDEAHRVEDVRHPIPSNVETYRRLAPAFELLRRQQAELGELLHRIDLG